MLFQTLLLLLLLLPTASSPSPSPSPSSSSPSTFTHLTSNFKATETQPESVSRLLATVSVRSKLECSVLCTGMETCRGMRVCRDDLLGTTTCELRASCGLGGCVEGLSDTSTASPTMKCVFSEKIRTSPLVCLNNGSVIGGQCACPIQYSGERCERLIRDCTEVYDRGYNNESAYGGAYFIQPLGVDIPFLVRCRFDLNGNTYALYRRRPATLTASNYTQLKDGFGDDLDLVPDSQHFFLGLEKLHHIVSQARYTLTLFMMGEDWKILGTIDYYNFTVGPEASLYALNFQSVDKNGVEDGFGGAGFPVRFSGEGLPGSESCAGSRGVAGWYGPGCYGYSPFADDLVWPVEGNATKRLNLMNFNLVRKSPFYDE